MSMISLNHEKSILNSPTTKLWKRAQTVTAGMLCAVVHCCWAAQPAEGGLKEAEQAASEGCAQPYLGYKQECNDHVLKRGL